MAPHHVHLRVMRRDDIPAGLRLCREANWNQVAADWIFFLESSRAGCRVAVDDAGGVIGSVATIAYGAAFTWIGMVLVDPQHRRRGIGTQLLQEALELLGDATTARLDATPAGRAVYVPLGFCDEYELQRMVRPATARLSAVARGTQASFGETRRSLGEGGKADIPDVRPMSDADFAEVVTFDRDVFGADRRALLDRCRTEAPEYAWAIGHDRLDGYLLGRHGHSFEQIGPLAARDESSARLLVSACVSAHADRPFIIDAPVRASWVARLESEGFTLQRPFMRMRRGERRFSDCVDRLFAIAGPEFG
jgi:GNAT superfamily N-acetyltransferase